jgi:hypothetical protein
MKHAQEYIREHTNIVKTQVLLMNKIVEYCTTQYG